MVTRLNRRAFTLVELLVVIAIIAILVGLLLPAVQAAREAGRRTQCINKVHQLGLALHNYASTNSQFPPSATMSGTTSKSVTGYSWLYKLLPYTEYTNLYKNMPSTVTTSALAMITSNGSVAIADQTKIPDFICPSNNNNTFINNTASPPTGSCTNYKAMAASTRNSLMLCIGTGTAPYGSSSLHPDGAIYPGASIPLASFSSDGLSHTIAIMETQDAMYSRWLVGTETALVGLPFVSSPTGTTPANATYPYFAPPGYDGTFGDSSAIAQKPLFTFLEFDFSPTGANYGKYEEATPQVGDTGASAAMTGGEYGPSSAHPAIAVAGFADGNATGLNKRCDAGNMFFLITRQNGDPYNLP